MVRAKFWLAALLVAGLGAGMATAANAQADSSVPTAKPEKPWRVKLGAFFPGDGDVKDEIGSTLFSYGVSYDFLKTNLANPIIVGAYLDGATGSKKRDGVTLRLSYVGLGPTARYYFTPVTSATRVYGGVGLGVYFVNSKASTRVGGATLSLSDDETKFGGKLLAGVESGQGLFGELDYTFISEINERNPGGFNVAVGYRF
ncbi:MAG: hypothetical protein SFU56_09365 [Capsulimonadales bacterium]|nr:hypothetical protein [Capsulimonadales bacterium]